MYSVVLNIQGAKAQRLLVNPSIISIPVIEDSGEPPNVRKFVQLPTRCHIAESVSDESSTGTAVEYDGLTNTMLPVSERSAFVSSEARSTIVTVPQRSTYINNVTASTMASVPQFSYCNGNATISRTVPVSQRPISKANVTTCERVPILRHPAYNSTFTARTIVPLHRSLSTNSGVAASTMAMPLSSSCNDTPIIRRMVPMPQQPTYCASIITNPMEPMPKLTASNTSVTKRKAMPKLTAYNASVATSTMVPMLNSPTYASVHIGSNSVSNSKTGVNITEKNYHIREHDSRPISKSSMPLLEGNLPSGLQISPILTDEDNVLSN